MASRRAIREAFYADLASAADGVPDSRVTQEYPDTMEELPTVVHRDAYRPDPMNTNTGPSDVTRNNLGQVTQLTYSITMEGVFSILVAAESEGEKESIYESIRTHFEEYELPIRDVDSLHDDVYKVRVEDVSSQDDEDREPTMRGDSFTITVGYERLHTLDVGAVESIDQAIDIAADSIGDGIDDINYTIE